MNQITRIFKAILSLIFILSAVGCDPGHGGKTYVNNQSPITLRLEYTSHHKDTIVSIQPNSRIEIFKFGGLGAGEDYTCCSCEFLTLNLQPTDTAKRIVKDINDKNTWAINNPNHWRFSGKEHNL